MPQQEMGSIKSVGAAAARIGKYRKRGQLPQRDPDSKKLMVLLVIIRSGVLPQREMGSIKSGGVAAKRSGQ